MFLALLVLATLTFEVRAASITVDASCSLPDAITAANTDTATGGCAAGSGSDTITIIAAGTNNGVITLSAALPTVTGVLTINGNGYTIDGDGQFPIFRVFGYVSLNRLTLANGRRVGDAGGAIHVRQTSQLTLRDSRLSGNSTDRGGGGIFATNADVLIERTVFSNNDGSSTAAGTGGGAIVYSTGPSPRYSLIIRESAFIGNSGYEGGAIKAIASTSLMIIENSTFYDNTSAVAGGAIYNDEADLTLRHVTIVDNTSTANASGSQLYHVSGASQTAVYNSIIHGDDSADDCNLSGNATLSGNLIGDGSCSPAIEGDPKLGSLVDGSYFPLLANSPAIDTADLAQCNNLNAPRDQRGQRRPTGAACDIGAYEYQAPSRVKSKTRGTTSAADESKADLSPGPAAWQILLNEGYLLWAHYGLESGVQFRRVDARGVGVKSIIDLGLVDAIDVYGYVEQGVEVCFPDSGYVVFLDAATAPRAIAGIASYSRDGYTCARINRPGTIVLTAMPSPWSLPQAPAEVGRALADCMVTTTHALIFRDGPGGRATGEVIPYLATLTALRRTADWFKVDFHGARGWISAAHVTARGSCA